MLRKFGSFSLVVLAALIAAPPLNAQVESGLHSRPRVTQSINEMDRMALSGNTRPEARLANDRGPVANDFALEHMQLQLKRSPEQELALQQFIDELHTKGSPNFSNGNSSPGSQRREARWQHQRSANSRRSRSRHHWSRRTPRFPAAYDAPSA